MKKHPPIKAIVSQSHRPAWFTRPICRAAGITLAGVLALGWPDQSRAGAADDGSEDKKIVPEKKAKRRVEFSLFVDAGITGNPNAPNDHQNFGRLFDDRANEPMLNQATVTVERALAPEPGRFDWGFKIQAGVGSDGRFLNTLGTLENVTRNIIQPFVVEAYGNLRVPLFAGKSVDFRFGQFVTILGAETTDPRTNYFYSHDYIFNFGVPFQHLGGLATFHLDPTVDFYAGATRGANTSIYDNNGRAAFLGGIGFNNLCANKLTVLATTSIGPENPREEVGRPSFHGGGPIALDDLRYYGDLVATYKATGKLTSITEGVYTYDSGFNTDFYGAAETLAYAINNRCTVAARLEVVRDSDGFFVAQFAANDDFTNLERGVTPLDPRTVGGGPNTYFETTVGVQIKPCKFLTLRPEVRFDHSTQGRPFDDSSRQDAITVAADAVVAF